MKLRFGVYATDKRIEIFRKLKPILRHVEDKLEAELSRPVRIRLRIFDTYKVGREALVRGYVDFARFGPASYIISKDQNPGISILAVEQQNGTHFFNGVIAVRRDSAIERVDDLVGRSFAFGDPTSTIGRYLAQSFLVDSGIGRTDLSHFEYLGRHDKVAEAVIAGKFDAGAMKEGTFSKYRSKGLVMLASFKNITKPWVARADLEGDVAAKLTEVLCGLKDKEVLKAIGKKCTGFRRGDDDLYDFVRAGIRKSTLFGGAADVEATAAAR